MAPLDPMRIWRVHQHDARCDGRIEQFVDELGIMPGHAGSRERSSQAVAAQRRDFVQGKARAGLGRPDREHPRSGRWFEHELIGYQPTGPCGKPGQARRRCELLPFDLLVAAIGLGRNSVIEGEEELFRLIDRARELDLIERLQVLNLCQL
ncbi:MAG TPA: hypothetical protein PLE80_10750 [Opitutaceae bacterium]|nr:hypothetical protein [Opitutaceae bacterium]